MRVAVFKRTVHLVRGPGAKPLLARALFSALRGFCLLFRVLWRPSWRICLCLVAFVPFGDQGHRIHTIPRVGIGFVFR